jgi:uncharacterized protein (TIGR03083 family)
VAATRSSCARFSALARSTPHDLPLPHLRRWKVHDVIAHLAGDHRWALSIVTTRTAQRFGITKARLRGDALCDLFDDVTARLLDALIGAAADPETRCPNFAQGEHGTLGWWPRHQAHEVAVHLWDLEAATGVHGPMDATHCLDGIDELFEVYTARYGGQRLTRPLTMRCPDHRRAWSITPAGEPGRVAIEPADGADHADLDAPPDALLLALWHRLPADHADLVFHGDAAAARAFLRGPITA